MVAFGFIFGFLLGIPVAVIDSVAHQWWLLPILGVDRRLDHQRPRHVADLRAARGEADPRHQGARAVPAPAGRGRGGLRADHRRRRRSPSSASATSCSTGRAATAPGRCSPRRSGRRSTRPPGPARAAVRVAIGLQPVRLDPRLGGRGGRRPHDDAVQGSRSFSEQQAEKIRTLFAARTKELPPRDFVEMMRVGDQGGRVDALRAWRDHGPRRWLPALVDLRGRRADDDADDRTRGPHARPSASGCPI